MSKKKKEVRKKSPAKRSASKTTHEVVVRVEPQSMTSISENDLLPEKEGGKFRVVASWLSEKQVLRMIQSTPKNMVLKRPGKGGKDFDYVPGGYFKKALNYAFGWNWDFFVISENIYGTIGSKGAQVVVKGRLVVKDEKSHTITKEDFGKHDVTYEKESKTPLDIGNDFKAAATDALKRCAVQLGIASDVYSKGEIKHDVNIDVQPPRNQALPPANYPPSKEHVYVPERESNPMDLVCVGALKSGCGNDITKMEADFSKKMYGKHLCRNCQIIAKQNKR